MQCECNQFSIRCIAFWGSCRYKPGPCDSVDHFVTYLHQVDPVISFRRLHPLSPVNPTEYVYKLYHSAIFFRTFPGPAVFVSVAFWRVPFASLLAVQRGWNRECFSYLSRH